MKKIVAYIAAAIMLLAPTMGSAQALNTAIDDIGVDRFAHAGCSYIIADQLRRAGMNRFWASATTLAIGAAKEQWLDDHFDRGDFAADCAGVLMWQIRF